MSNLNNGFEQGWAKQIWQRRLLQSKICILNDGFLIYFLVGFPWVKIIFYSIKTLRVFMSV